MSERRGLWILLGLVAFGAVLAGPLLSSHEGPLFAGIPGIENKIESSAVDLLIAEGVDFDAISVEGRDLSVTLADAAPDGLDDRLRGIALVRDVNFESPGGTTTPSSEPSTSGGTDPADASSGAAEIDVRFDGQRIDLSGAVISERGRETLESNAARVVGADGVSSDIELLDQAGDDLERVSAVAAIVGRLDSWFASADLRLEGDQLQVSGTTRSDGDQAQAEQVIGQLAQSVGISSSFNVLVDPSAPVVGAPTEAPTPTPTAVPPPTPTAPAADAGADDSQADAEASDSEADAGDSEADASDAAATIESLDLDGVTFEVGTAALTAEATEVLADVASQLQTLEGVDVEVQGHTDATGDPDVNLLLSQLRAEAVRDFLVDAGVSADSLTARGYGASEPVADNSTETGQAANRRVELVVVEGNN